MHTYITANGSLVPCCEAQETKLGDENGVFTEQWNGPAYQELRSSLLKGEKPEMCRKCWRNEDDGLLSNRQQALKDLEENHWGELEIKTDSEMRAESPVFIEMKCNNVCNLKCRMCHPESSYKIGEDREIIDKYRKGLPWSDRPLSSKARVKDLTRIDQNVLDKVRVLQFSGGEPLLSREQLDVVQYLLKRNPEEISLRYATNLTYLRFEEFDYLNAWKRFKHVNIKISADGLNDVYDYVRVGSNFERVLQNLKTLKSMNLPNVTIGMGFTVQAYNVFQVADFVDFFEEYVPRQAISTHLLHTPRIMAVDALPLELRQRMAKNIRSKRRDLEGICQVLERSPDAPAKWETLLAYSREMEKKYSIENGFESLLKRYVL